MFRQEQEKNHKRLEFSDGVQCHSIDKFAWFISPPPPSPRINRLLPLCCTREKVICARDGNKVHHVPAWLPPATRSLCLRLREIVHDFAFARKHAVLATPPAGNRLRNKQTPTHSVLDTTSTQAPRNRVGKEMRIRTGSKTELYSPACPES